VDEREERPSARALIMFTHLYVINLSPMHPGYLRRACPKLAHAQPWKRMAQGVHEVRLKPSFTHAHLHFQGTGLVLYFVTANLSRVGSPRIMWLMRQVSASWGYAGTILLAKPPMVTPHCGVSGTMVVHLAVIFPTDGESLVWRS
jgi:hypothetical protein